MKNCITELFLPGHRVCIDSREVQAGDFFFALRGNRVDGHHYLVEVASRGSQVAVISKGYDGPTPEGLSLFYVEDPLLALQDLARQTLKRRRSRIIAITGSLGKTSTKSFLYSLLSKKYRVSCSLGNRNSQVGLPLTILNDTTGDEDFLILEMAMTEPGQIKNLVSIAPPEIAVITTVALVHAENFDSLSAIAQAKGEIFSHPKTKLGIMPQELFSELGDIGSCKKIPFVDVDLPLPFPGRNHRHNFSAAATVAKELGITWEKNPHLSIPDRRGNLIEREGILFIDDSYNAAVPSVIAALENMPEPKKQGRRIAVLAEMPELGKFSDACHQEVGASALDHVDRLYCTGPACKPMQQVWQEAEREVFYFEDRDDLVKCLKKDLQSDDVVLLKGANRWQLWKVLDIFND